MTRGRSQLTSMVRLDYAQDTRQVTVDPRFQYRFEVDWLVLKSGVGLYSQPPEHYQSFAENAHRMRSIRSVHLGAGAEITPTPWLSMGVEGFYKYLWDWTVRDDSASGLAFDNDGSGRIYGMELSARIDPGQERRYFAYASYTLMRSERRANRDRAYRPFNFDQTHILTVSGVYRFRNHVEIGLTGRFVSGNPYTPILGSIYDPAHQSYVPVRGRGNSARLPSFHRLDLRIEKQWIHERFIIAAFLDIQNAFNHQNVEQLMYSEDFDDSVPVTGLPIIPAFGVRGEF